MSGEQVEFVAVDKQAAATVIRVAGDIDLHRSPALHEHLVTVCSDKPAVLVIDLHAVAYMDSSGVGTLVHAYRLVKEYQGKMRLVGLTDRVRSVFEISRLDQYFPIFGTVEEALSS